MMGVYSSQAHSMPPYYATDRHTLGKAYYIQCVSAPLGYVSQTQSRVCL